MEALRPLTVAEIQHGDFFSFPVRFDPKTKEIALARGIWRFKTIVIGRAWLHLGWAEQQAVLAHEAGHCLAMHMERRLLLLPFCWTKWAQRIARQDEFDADAFAVREGHGLGMLGVIRLMMRVQAALPGPPTFEQHIDRLMSPPYEERMQQVLRLMQEKTK